MVLESCIPVIPSADLEKSLRFWVDGLGLSMDRAMRQDGRLVGCMVHNERLYLWLNQRPGSPIKPENYEGIRLLARSPIPTCSTTRPTGGRRHRIRRRHHKGQRSDCRIG